MLADRVSRLARGIHLVSLGGTVPSTAHGRPSRLRPIRAVDGIDALVLGLGDLLRQPLRR